jgi:hypothetical protein
MWQFGNRDFSRNRIFGIKFLDQRVPNRLPE